ncbi:hypothetical protein LXL04_008024 [Taraxacum kok-saghyz]
MSSHFERWEKDPFFSAAEEVQESADRMESTYRTLVQALKEPSAWKTDELRRDLRTALGTAKWQVIQPPFLLLTYIDDHLPIFFHLTLSIIKLFQLEEFDRAVAQSYTKLSTEDAKTRHSEFIKAIDCQITKVSKALDESAISTGKPPRPWIRLNEGETEELASFLSGSNTNVDQKEKQKCPNERPEEVASHEGKHRRTASAGADIGAWNIVVDDDDGGKSEQPPRKIPSFSGFLNAMDSASKLKWSKNGYRKLKLVDNRHELPETQQPVTRGMNALCYERSKSCLENGDDCYQKQLYGWYGGIQRQLQRSQYYVQYSRPTQILFSLLLFIFLIALVTVHVM